MIFDPYVKMTEEVRLLSEGDSQSSRIRNKFWHIVFDGTQLCVFKERHCEHCLKREFKDENKNVIRTEYYHVVLEAKLVINEKIVLSVGSEFVENENPDVKKQDCELNAFYRLAKKIGSFKIWVEKCKRAQKKTYTENPIS